MTKKTSKTMTNTNMTNATQNAEARALPLRVQQLRNEPNNNEWADLGPPPTTPPRLIRQNADDWGAMGPPPPPPRLVRQIAFDANLFNAARRLDFEEEEEEEEKENELPEPLYNM